jgi:hypothetical protein
VITFKPSSVHSGHYVEINGQPATIIVNLHAYETIPSYKEKVNAEISALIKKHTEKLFSIGQVASICHTLFSATPAGSLQKWENRHYVAFITDLLIKGIPDDSTKTPYPYTYRLSPY